MTKFKKMTAVLLSVVMLVFCFTVQAGAASAFDNARKLSAKETVNISNNTTSNKDVYFKIILNDSGELYFISKRKQRP